MKIWALLVSGVSLAFWAMAEEEGSSQRLENAQKGIAEASWPRKPDSRMSPLSGKVKEISELSPKFYGQEKEFRAKEAGEWQKEARLGFRGSWESPAGRGWEEARWNQGRDWDGGGRVNGQFPLSQELASEKTVVYRQLDSESAPDWSSRSASLGAGTEGSLRMYEGRLTRVREQVWREEQNPRELGEGRQEKFSPQEVEKMLSQTAGELRRAKEQSPEASPPATEGN